VRCVIFWSRFLVENTKTLVRVGMVDGASLGLELGLVEWLSLGETDALGWIDGVAVGWSVGWFDFIDGVELINLTLVNDRTIEGHPSNEKALHRSNSQHFADKEEFQEVIQVDLEQLKTADHDDIKLRNLPASFQMSGGDPEAGVVGSPSAMVTSSVVDGLDDLIELTHLHEPAILMHSDCDMTPKLSTQRLDPF
jgi:hypothetical protein